MSFSTFSLYIRLARSLNIIKIAIASRLNTKTIANITVAFTIVISLYNNLSKGILLIISNIYIQEKYINLI